MGERPSRRGLLLLGVGVVAGGCSPQPASSVGATGPSTSPTARSTGSRGGTGTSTRPPRTPTPSGTQPTTGNPPPPALPSVTAWTPDRGDLVPACKLTAVRRIERAGNGRDTALQVIDAQYGGLLTDTASVLVVTRSWRRTGSRITADGHTYDVRLSRFGAWWRVTAIHPSRPGPPASHSAAARHVLASGRIDLPPAARRDVLSGQVHGSVLLAMLAVSRAHRIGVSVVRSGHPLYVFGTNRLSDHPQGRAFDTWAIDGRPVVDPRTPQGLVVDYMRAVAAAGSYNVGGPYLLGAAPQWFSDATHHDHVHAGFAT